MSGQAVIYSFTCLSPSISLAAPPGVREGPVSFPLSPLVSSPNQDPAFQTMVIYPNKQLGAF